MARLLLRSPGGDEQRRARLHLADWLGCAAAGAGEQAGAILLRRPLQSALDAAFSWGGLGNILEMDDVDKRALLHPGPVVNASVLALAEERGAAAEDVLDAVVRGYEATIRLGRAVGPQHYARFHNTGTCGPVGAAAACASLLGLHEDAMTHALSLAASQAAGLWQTRHEPASMGKQLHTAHAARAGMEAALLADDGFVGPETIFEGEQGFFAGLCPDGKAEDVLSGGEAWRIHDVSFKPWPACRHAHAAIDAALALRGRVRIDEGAEVEVATYGDALKFCDRTEPETTLEAKFSLQHAVAVTLLKGAPELGDFEGEAIFEERTAALRRRVSVWRDAGFDDAYPARFGASVRVNGDEQSVPDAWGDPENPVGSDDIRAKALRLLRRGGMTGRDDVIDALLDGTFEVRDVADLLREVSG